MKMLTCKNLIYITLFMFTMNPEFLKPDYRPKVTKNTPNTLPSAIPPKNKQIVPKPMPYQPKIKITPYIGEN